MTTQPSNIGQFKRNGKGKTSPRVKRTNSVKRISGIRRK